MYVPRPVESRVHFTRDADGHVQAVEWSAGGRVRRGPHVAIEEIPVAFTNRYGALLRGVRYVQDGAVTDSIVMRSRSGTVRRIEARHKFEKLTQFTGREYP